MYKRHSGLMNNTEFDWIATTDDIINIPVSAIEIGEIILDLSTSNFYILNTKLEAVKM